MELFNNTASLRTYLKQIRKQSLSVGLVPTMGALHDGHIELILNSIKENDITVCSIFVNPTQFNSTSDLDKYPRTLDRDLKLLEDNRCDIVYFPTESDVYTYPQVLKFNFGALEEKMEGKHRPGHFNGVALIVSKLFNIVEPHKAYFGQKDLQQFKIIDQLVKDLSFDIQLIRIPTKRDKNGLALSSRNMRLTDEGRSRARGINSSLVKAEQLLKEGYSMLDVVELIESDLKNDNIELEYLELVDIDTFKSLKNKNITNPVALCIAAYIEGIRLIDNRIF